MQNFFQYTGSASEHQSNTQGASTNRNNDRSQASNAMRSIEECKASSPSATSTSLQLSYFLQQQQQQQQQDLTLTHLTEQRIASYRQQTHLQQQQLQLQLLQLQQQQINYRFNMAASTHVQQPFAEATAVSRVRNQLRSQVSTPIVMRNTNPYNISDQYGSSPLDVEGFLRRRMLGASMRHQNSVSAHCSMGDIYTVPPADCYAQCGIPIPSNFTPASHIGTIVPSKKKTVKEESCPTKRQRQAKKTVKCIQFLFQRGTPKTPRASPRERRRTRPEETKAKERVSR